MINKEDIKITEALLLPEGETFDDEKVAFILNNESKDLVACAGSGKTTALIAKLILLQRDLPFEGEKGICVLTHTNVALEEIYQRGFLRKLLDHPNSFIGTIQEFVNTFLGIPAYKHMFKRSPKFIDDEATSRKLLSKLASNKNAYPYLRNRASLSRFDPAEVLTEEIRFSLKNDEITYVKGINGASLLKNKTTEAYKAIHEIKYGTLEEGFLMYDDAYSLAFWYLEKFPFLKEIIRYRFKYLFIDEMQDTGLHQMKILEEVFKPEKTIVQRVGDPNQAIYEEGHTVWTPRTPLHLTNSRRLSIKICNAIQNIRLDTSEKMTGDKKPSEIPPQVILFDQGQEQKVIDQFVKKISEFEDHLDLNQEKDRIKIICWNCSDKTKKGTNIQKFFPSFIKPKNLGSKYFHNIETYLNLRDQNSFKKTSLKSYSDLLLDILSRFSYEQGIQIQKTRPSNYRIYNFIKENPKLNKSFFTLSLVLATCKNPSVYIRKFVENEFLEHFDEKSPIKVEARKFLNNENQPENIPTQRESGMNEYVKFKGIPITFSSIHGVKGETLKALLYLESDIKNTCDLKSVIKYLCGEEKPNPIEATEQSRLKTCYVGLSRASHLLCLAIRKTNIEAPYLKKLLELGWEIKDINENPITLSPIQTSLGI